ncbi:MAG: molybdenum cofactor biosynthesis protein MoaE [Boseongicola sp. SB0664_bin_43]|uniref:Molybdopterin synthase catalytic subunit n=1 Tax=Boseongicola sp. SB0664_bin_43 TaxID=2604844 RepID=A0A6B0Y0X5_9RHOB|nr:molybdenum cofactor biosynthesis protein MoaE [Boseongicola sp. SB0664_bin_43]MYK31025.1 molybdenum cofactor biosynthesis protein MoaE [Boseongicola sp. SB0670_bin_30]
MTVRIQPSPFDIGSEVRRFADSVSGAGAVVTFSGLVRDDGGRLTAMEIEHYPAMTERAVEAIRTEAMERWSLLGAVVIHRYGRFEPGEQIMMVATAALHRADAFMAAEFLMDYLKSRAPFWKKEIGPDGEKWVAAKDEDEDALARW